MKATFFDQLTIDDPIVAKFALYLLAHTNYLDSLPYEIMRDYKINWGLGKTLKLKESSHVFENFDKTFNSPATTV